MTRKHQSTHMRTKQRYLSLLGIVETAAVGLTFLLSVFSHTGICTRGTVADYLLSDVLLGWLFLHFYLRDRARADRLISVMAVAEFVACGLSAAVALL